MDVTTIAVDLARRVFQVHGYDAVGDRVLVRRLKGACTALMNQLRGLLGEYGWVFAQGEAALRRGLRCALEDARLPGPDARAARRGLRGVVWAR